LQSQTRHSAENRFSINGSAIVHGRPLIHKLDDPVLSAKNAAGAQPGAPRKQ
jgi:hypothetical protein